MNGRILLVIPPVTRLVNGNIEFEADFAHNLRMYLTSFSGVAVACPLGTAQKTGSAPRSVPVAKIQGSERLTYIPLPYTYNETSHLLHYFSTKALLRSEITKADFLLFSPHAKYDWSTVAALLAIKMKRKYDIESDWDHGSVQRLQLASMKPGLNRVRKKLWMGSFLKTVEKCMAHSTLALLQGQDVFNAYKNIAPNPHKVLNVQVSGADYISFEELSYKMQRIEKKGQLVISYAGRMIPMKGPFDWLKTIHSIVKKGVSLRATWFGAGSEMMEMRREVESLGIANEVTLTGDVDRDEVMAQLRKTDIFLFCHKTAESPRCLSEALAAGCPLVGYRTAYAEDLVDANGGGKFCEIADWESLTNTVVSLDRDRRALSALVRAAAASGSILDRDTAMQYRIDLIKKYLP